MLGETSAFFFTAPSLGSLSSCYALVSLKGPRMGAQAESAVHPILSIFFTQVVFIPFVVIPLRRPLRPRLLRTGSFYLRLVSLSNSSEAGHPPVCVVKMFAGPSKLGTPGISYSGCGTDHRLRQTIFLLTHPSPPPARNSHSANSFSHRPDFAPLAPVEVRSPPFSSSLSPIEEGCASVSASSST